ncbi:MAG: pyridoxal phosphate-dependent aminotransferase [Candidatus Gracilibacteria bacterium]|nr:pyridoxal phosphate-dependent aminotransferase [bacterium]MDZ4216715.1 pyridoxal phosphate-dependent aminotransferase [Candidatus Gracilibacteria bacterium]
MAQKIQLQSGESFTFDIHESNPFLVFPWLQKLAIESVGRDALLDLSRGDPGYGFSPTVRSRRFYGYLVFLDSLLNNDERRLVDRKPDEVGEILDIIRGVTTQSYESETAQELLSDWEEYLTKFKAIAGEQGLPDSDWDILLHTFGYSNCTGGNYHNPWGEPYTRAVLAHWHEQVLGQKVSYQDLMVASGASHAIGTIYEALGEEGIGYLKKRDRVVLFSPSYFPYVNLNESRGLETVMIRLDPYSGEINRKDLEKAGEQPIKMIVLIDPNNPTGFCLTGGLLDEVAELAERTNALIVTDEVYLSFLKGKKSLIQYKMAGKRTIRIDSLSKIERSTGIRFGDIYITQEGDRFISKSILQSFLRSGDTVRQLLFRAKSPGGGQVGAFQHTTVMPGPCQFLGISHILLGEAGRKAFVGLLQENMRVFHEVLGLPYQGNIYYSLFDLKAVPGWNRNEKEPEECFIELARLGVVLIPSNLFFFVQDRAEARRQYICRVSLANLSTERCKQAAELIRAYVSGV